MDVAVVGAGYVGLVTAVCLADLGHSVTLLEIDEQRLGLIRQGKAPFHEPGLGQLLDRCVTDGRLGATDSPAEALGHRDLVLVCVGTPLGPNGDADLTQVRQACEAISSHGGATGVVIRSTLPVGSAPLIADWLGRTMNRGVVTNPEFLREGTALGDFRSPTRIVIGTATGESTLVAELVVDLYRGIDSPVIITDFATAEMIKNASNGFLAMKLSFVNEIADLCEAYGADVEGVVKGIGLDPRIGSGYLRPGIGFGGSCLPKELANLVRLGQQRNLAMHMFAAATTANEDRPAHIADRLARTLGDLAGKQVALLGLSFKPHTDDVRYSPAIALARELVARGAVVRAHDPWAPESASSSIPGLTRVADPDVAFHEADLVILATEWPLYSTLDWKSLAARARQPIIFDGRNALDHRTLEDCGWQVIRVGVSAERAPAPP